jgi:hypothetical protein
MSTCILTGFAKKKRRLGTSYSCDGGDLPATQDLGTSVFSGPYESAQTVPATEVTYTIIGSTPCGGTIRRISTKTYSSRSVVNQWKVTANYVSSVYGNYSLTGIIMYGTTVAEASGKFAALAVQSSISFPDPLQYPTGVFYYSKFTLPNDGNVYYAVRTQPPQAPTYSNYLLGSLEGISSTQLTLYYLDPHEVLTYDLV